MSEPGGNYAAPAPQGAQYGPSPYGWPPAAPQPPAKKKRKWIMPAALLLGGMVIGGGAAGATKPEPEVITQVETKTVTKEVEVTPKSCITAIDLAQQGFTYSAETMGYMNDALQAAGKFNVAGIEQANRDMERLNPKIKALTDPMKLAVAECRAKAK